MLVKMSSEKESKHLPFDLNIKLNLQMFVKRMILYAISIALIMKREIKYSLFFTGYWSNHNVQPAAWFLLKEWSSIIIKLQKYQQPLSEQLKLPFDSFS